MDERRILAALAPAKQQFICPGNTRPIDRATHLARLAAFYPECLVCEDRHDTGGLSSIDLQTRAAIERHAATPWNWSDEGLEGVTGGRIDLSVVSDTTLALAALAWQHSRSQPVTLVGCDGSGATAELVALACRNLALAGCGAIELGAVTTAALAIAAAEQRAAAALWIGNASGSSHAVSLRFFGAGGTVWSAPGMLDSLRARAAEGPVRARRSGGCAGRLDADGPYLAKLEDVFHGLRPLTVVLDSSSQAIGHYWRVLSRPSACRVVTPGEGVDLATRTAAEQGGWGDERLQAVGRQVILDGAHFGAWIDGAGECCWIVDERGEPVAPRRVLQLLGKHLGADRAAPPPWLEGNVRRQQLADLAREARDPVVGDEFGRVHLAGSPVADGFAALCLLLVVLSQSDRPLSEVLDQDAPDR